MHYNLCLFLLCIDVSLFCAFDPLSQPGEKKQADSKLTLQFPRIQQGIMADTREKALQDYRKKLLEHKEVDGRLKECKRLFNVDIVTVLLSAPLFELIR